MKTGKNLRIPLEYYFIDGSYDTWLNRKYRLPLCIDPMEKFHLNIRRYCWDTGLKNLFEDIFRRRRI